MSQTRTRRIDEQPRVRPPRANRGQSWSTTVILAGGGLLAHSVWDLFTRPVEGQWLILAALTVSTGLAHPADSDDYGSQLFNFGHLQHRRGVAVGPSAGAITAAVDGLVLCGAAGPQSALDRPGAVQHGGGDDRRLGRRAGVLCNRRQSPDARRPARGGAAAGDAARLRRDRLRPEQAASSRRRSASNGGSRLSIWRAHLAGVWLTYFGGIFGGDAGDAAGAVQRARTLILIVPLPVILYMTFRHALGARQDQIDHLGRSTRSTSAPSRRWRRRSMRRTR